MKLLTTIACLVVTATSIATEQWLYVVASVGGVTVMYVDVPGWLRR